MPQRRALAVFAAGVTLVAVICVAVLRAPQPRSPEAVLVEEAAGDGDDFVCEIPDVTALMTATGDPDYSHPLPACDAFAKFVNDPAFTYVNIANAWKAAGMNMKYCPAAVVIAGGECEPPSAGSPPSLCDLQRTGASGLWQTDYVLNAPESKVGPDAKTRVLNPCENARYGYGNFVKTPDDYAKGCYTGKDGATTPPLMITCDSKDTCPVGGGVGGCDWDYSQGHCNW